jgi:hypothetical protein
MHILFWRKNEKFRKSRNSKNLFLEKLASLKKNLAFKLLKKYSGVFHS